MNPVAMYGCFSQYGSIAGLFLKFYFFGHLRNSLYLIAITMCIAFIFLGHGFSKFQNLNFLTKFDDCGPISKLSRDLNRLLCMEIEKIICEKN